jgi:heme-degrading monooxygenase HmoA
MGYQQRLSALPLTLPDVWTNLGNKMPHVQEGIMAIKVLIKRRVPSEKARETITLFRQLRILATAQDGYISGETLRSLEKPEEFIVISTWQSSQDWKNWLASRERREIQSKIDQLLGGETTYETYHYGFTG